MRMIKVNHVPGLRVRIVGCPAGNGTGGNGTFYILSHKGAGKMRSLQRRKQSIWFVQRTKDDSSIDITYTYGKPILKHYTVSNTAGSIREDLFGILPKYDRYIVSYEMSFVPEEGSLVYVDRTPQLDREKNLVLNKDGEPTVTPDYTVYRVWRAAKGTKQRIGLRKVGFDEADD